MNVFTEVKGLFQDVKMRLEVKKASDSRVPQLLKQKDKQDETNHKDFWC